MRACLQSVSPFSTMCYHCFSCLFFLKSKNPSSDSIFQSLLRLESRRIDNYFRAFSFFVWPQIFSVLSCRPNRHEVSNCRAFDGV